MARPRKQKTQDPNKPNLITGIFKHLIDKQTKYVQDHDEAWRSGNSDKYLVSRNLLEANLETIESVKDLVNDFNKRMKKNAPKVNPEKPRIIKP